MTEDDRAFTETAVAFEDLTAALLKTQAVRVDSRHVLAALVSPHSVEARHAAVRTRLVIDRARLTATPLRDERPVLRVRVAIGTPSTPTPKGGFSVRKQRHGYRSPFYGPVALGTSARSTGASDWPAGGFVGIHGTNRPDLIPGWVSHGVHSDGQRRHRASGSSDACRGAVTVR